MKEFCVIILMFRTDSDWDQWYSVAAWIKPKAGFCLLNCMLATVSTILLLSLPDKAIETMPVSVS